MTAACAAAHREATGDGRETDVGQGARPSNEALPAENRENGLQIWQEARAALGAAARRSSAGRILAGRKTGARRTRHTMWQGARRRYGVVGAQREAASDGVEEDVGHGSRPGKENRENG